MANDYNTKPPPWPDDSRRDPARGAPAWVQVRANAWPPEPIDDHEDPVDDDVESPATVSWGFPGNPVVAPPEGPGSLSQRQPPRPSARTVPQVAADEDDGAEIPAMEQSSGRSIKRSSLGTPEYLGRSNPAASNARVPPSPRTYYSATGAGSRSRTLDPEASSVPPGGRRVEEPPPRRVADGTGPHAGRSDGAAPAWPRGAAREFDEKPTEVGFGAFRGGTPPQPPRGASPMPAPSSSRMFEDDDPEKSDQWSSYSPPKPKRNRGTATVTVPGRVSTPRDNTAPIPYVRFAVGVMLLIAALVVAVVGFRTVSAPARIVVGDAPMLPVVGGPIPTADPPPPFDVEAPSAFRAQLLTDKTFAVDTVAVAISDARLAGQIDLAAAYADKLTRTTADPSTFFQLGELLAENGQVDAAFYWLVRGVREFGTRPERFVERDSFGALWGDARWDAFSRWTVQVRRYQTSKGSAAPRVILPASVDAAVAMDAARRPADPRARSPKGGKPTLPVLLWFDPADGTGVFVQQWGQQVADDLGVIVINVIGPDRVGPLAGAWSGDPARDRAQVDAALAAVSTITPDATRRYAVGTGQGGTWAVELAMRDPSFLAGALALHPTDEWRGPRDASAESNHNRSQVVSLMAGGHDEGEHAFLRVERGRLLRAGIDATMDIDERPWPGGAPADLKARVVTWLQARLTGGGTATPRAGGVPSVPSP